eukprot:m.23706 g.23706  ORF g.23706 m.23706 type:complete len:160 (-) comp4162_c0_seq1:77-556(-)
MCTNHPAMRLALAGRRLRQFVQFGCFVHIAHNYVGHLTMCVGPSMLPTINSKGDIVIEDCISKRLGLIKRGDIVVARSPRNPKILVAKRVTAVAGDEVTINPKSAHPVKKKIPKDHVWLQGDNVDNSRDSRAYGPVPMALVNSRIALRVWPPSQAGFLQ